MKKNWKNLKGEFIHKSEIVLKFKSILDTSKKSDESDLNKTELYAKELIRECENKKINKESINNVKLKNDSLNIYLVRILVNLESDMRLKSSEEILDELTLSEQDIFTKISDYNLICQNSNNQELLFPIKNID
ncbi:hypothetical protein [Flavobacterium sp. HTF]|uniref:hypothetical protein n=1 Tax=Flavobacterium sp. HTF TaxID=2170732 RepID=UPI000D5C313D|nr:hypothetical protein [Flavobacterium sp. HTF]PWB22008.1 hypothetical protein DCO46_18370 [Flavobacterium sp. HTF]